MIRFYSNKKYLFALLTGVTLLLSSCYSDHVHLKLEPHIYHPKAVYQYNDSSMVAFVSTQEAYRRATGISAFPDGGQVKVIYRKTGLYIYDIKNRHLSLLKDMTTLPMHFSNKPRLLFIDSLVYYISELKEYTECFSININSKEVNVVDIAEFNSLYEKYYKRGDFSGIKKLSLAEFGLVIQNIYPKSDEEYIDEIIYRTSDGQTTRRAVIEQIISKLDKKEIKQILKRMDNYSKTLEGYDKSSYDYYSKETYESIKELL
ncbi:MAG: hypothetical protein GQ534_01475 [Candidatus Delongbacteria bacterium]|nr:hypothetical protein [Candidatus Delongbacteria bacterium]